MLELRGDGGVWRSHNQRWHQHRLSMAMAAVAGLSMVSDQQRKQERCVMCELWTLKLEVWKNCYFRGTGFTQGTKVLWLRVTFFLFPPPTRGVWRSHNQRWHQHRLSMAMAAVAGLSMVSDQQRKQERCVMCELWTLKFVFIYFTFLINHCFQACSWKRP